MYTIASGLILGFHGCDQSVVDKVIRGEDELLPSNNLWDWLGNGVYFWENSPSRAFEFAIDLSKHPERTKHPIKNPAVIGAVINLGYCLNLLDYQMVSILQESYNALEALMKSSGLPLPKNHRSGTEEDLLRRNLDCAVIETLHNTRRRNGHQLFDSVKGVFWEGKPLYEGAGFREKDHIQICIRNPNCIKGYFLPRALSSKFPKV